jgi:prepilin-type N-terminal cleavage/methylation domain-containing protein
MEMARLIMAAVANRPDTAAGRGQDQAGFSLIEVLVAMLILTAGLLPLAGVFAVAVQRMTAATPQLLAREKAREAIESVHAARDTGAASWATIQNDEVTGGVFLTGPQAIRDPGNDGLVNTDDDGDIQLSEGLFTREIDISPLLIDGSEDSFHQQLREVRVVVRYSVSGTWFTYVLTTYISSYS